MDTVETALAHAVADVGDPERAIEALLAAWRLVPSPELVVEIEAVATQLPRPPEIRKAKHWRTVQALRRTRDVPVLLTALAMPWGSAFLADLCGWRADPRIADALALRAATAPLPDMRDRIAGWLSEIGDRTVALSPGARAGLAAFTNARLALRAEHREFIAQVLEDPDDDGPRLVYGDWLQERGDPRGEFIALQFRKHRGRISQPEGKRMNALLADYQHVWLGGLDRPGIVPLVYERGFASEIQLGTGMDDDPDWATVRKIQLASYVRGAELAPVVTQPSMRSLRELGFVDSWQLSALCANREPLSITRLALSSDRFGEGLEAAALVTAPALPHVEHLEIRDCRTDWILRADLLPRLRSLQIPLIPPELFAPILLRGDRLERLVVRHWSMELVYSGPRLSQLSLRLDRPDELAWLLAHLAALPAEQLRSWMIAGSPHLTYRVRAALAGQRHLPR